VSTETPTLANIDSRTIFLRRIKPHGGCISSGCRDWYMPTTASVCSQILFSNRYRSVGVSVPRFVMRSSRRSARVSFRGATRFQPRRLFATLAALPLVLPPLVGHGCFYLLCGESAFCTFGPISFSFEQSPWSLRGWTALLLFHTYTSTPSLHTYRCGFDENQRGLAEAGRSLGASRGAACSLKSFCRN